MKVTALAAIAATLFATATFAGGSHPNNYIYTDSTSGVVASLDYGGDNFDPGTRPVRTVDLASQIELDAAMTAQYAAFSKQAAGLAAIGAIQMDSSYSGLQVSVGAGYADGATGFALGIGTGLGYNGFGFVSVTDQGSAAVSINFRF